MIRLENVSVEYRLKSERVQALRNLNLRIVEGSFEAIMGLSGSGQNDAHPADCGFAHAYVREVIVSGENLSRLDDEKISAFRNRTIGFVFQFFNLPNYYTAVDNAALPLVFAGVDERTRRIRARTLLAEIGLQDRLDHPRTSSRAVSATGRDRPRPDQQSEDHPRRRTDRQPRPRERART